MPKHSAFPEIIRELPEADLPLAGVRAYLSQSDSHQIVFMEFADPVEIPEHSHGAQWGVVVSGTIELCIEGRKRVLTKGDHYFLPAHCKHSAKIFPGYADISFFSDPHRYQPRAGQQEKLAITGIDHLVLTVKDIRRTCSFYAHALGMEIRTSRDGRVALGWGKQKINLHTQGDAVAPKARNAVPGSADICLLTETPIGRVMEELQHKGVEIILGPIERSGAQGPIHSLYLHDPDGNLVEVANLA